MATKRKPANQTAETAPAETAAAEDQAAEVTAAAEAPAAETPLLTIAENPAEIAEAAPPVIATPEPENLEPTALTNVPELVRRLQTKLGITPTEGNRLLNYIENHPQGLIDIAEAAAAVQVTPNRFEQIWGQLFDLKLVERHYPYKGDAPTVFKMRFLTWMNGQDASWVPDASLRFRGGSWGYLTTTGYAILLAPTN